MAVFTFVNKANKYARDIVSEKIPACRYVRLACQRHLDDLEKSKSPDYPYKFNKNAAERVCKFVQLLPHTKGKWARLRGEKARLTLEPWQLFLFCCVFGWVHKASGLRRFREVYDEIPKNLLEHVEDVLALLLL